MVYRKAIEAFRVRGLRVQVGDLIVVKDSGDIDLLFSEDGVILREPIYNEAKESSKEVYWMTNSDIKEMNEQIIKYTEVV